MSVAAVENTDPAEEIHGVAVYIKGADSHAAAAALIAEHLRNDDDVHGFRVVFVQAGVSQVIDENMTLERSTFHPGERVVF